MIGEEFLMRMCEGGITSTSRVQRATKKNKKKRQECTHRPTRRTIKVVRRRNQPYLALFQAETKLPRFQAGDGEATRRRTAGDYAN